MPQAHQGRLGDDGIVVRRQRQQQRQVLGRETSSATGQRRGPSQGVTVLDLLQELTARQHAIGGSQCRGHGHFDRLVDSTLVVKRCLGHRADVDHQRLDLLCLSRRASATSLVGHLGEMQLADRGRDGRKRRARGGSRPSACHRCGLVEPAQDSGFDRRGQLTELDHRPDNTGVSERVELIHQRTDVDRIDAPAHGNQPQAAAWTDAACRQP